MSESNPTKTELEDKRAATFDELRREIALGIKALDEGRSSVFDEATLARIQARGRQLLAERKREPRATGSLS